jgi:outer membrane protein assembly factor BamB
MLNYRCALLLPLLFSFGCSHSQLAPKELHLERMWVRDPLTKEELGFRKLHQMTPLIYENIVIFGNAIEGLTAYDRKTANLVWRLNIKNGVEMGGQIEDGIFYTGANDGQFYAIEAASGRVKWSMPIESEGLGKPTVVGKRIYFMAGNHVVYALNSDDGKVVWSYKRLEASTLSIRGNSQPSVSGSNVYVGFNDGFLVAINKDTGAATWEVQLNTNKRFRDIDSRPVIDGEKLYVSGFEQALFCVDSKNGQILWQFDEGGYSSVLVDEDQIYFATTKGHMYSINKQSGKPNWTYKLPEGIATEPILHKGHLIFGESQGALRILDARSGLKLGEYYPGRGVFSMPNLDKTSNDIYFVSGEGNLYAIKMEWRTQASLWAWEMK